MQSAIDECVGRYDRNIELKPRQRECLEHVYQFDDHRCDLIANLPVGYGKSLIYHVLPDLLSKKNASHRCVLVISPLNIIHTDQMNSLKKHGITSCRLDIGGKIESDEDTPTYGVNSSEALEDIRMGNFSVIFCHPEALLNTAHGHSLLTDDTFQQHVFAVVVDECHIVEEWGKEFRKAFGKLKQLPASFPHAPFIALSGTLTTEQLKRLPEHLGLKSPVLIQENPDRPNIFLEKQEKESCGGDVIEMFEKM